MLTKTVNTYACKQAIAISNPVTKNTIIKGKKCAKAQILPIDTIVHPNPAKIFNRVCPDIIFANNRIAKLKTRAIYEINSIIIKYGATIKGAPVGKNNPKNFNPCFRTPIILIAKKVEKDNVKVKIK